MRALLLITDSRNEKSLFKPQPLETTGIDVITAGFDCRVSVTAAPRDEGGLTKSRQNSIASRPQKGPGPAKCAFVGLSQFIVAKSLLSVSFRLGAAGASRPAGQVPDQAATANTNLA
jgi:hypothetical protein